MKTKKTKKGEKSLDSKKKKVLEIGAMVVFVSGIILFLINDNIMFLVYGLLFGIILEPIVNKDIVFTFWPTKKKKKSNKK